MTESQWIVGAIGCGALSLLAWKSVGCLVKGRRLLRWRRPSLKGLDDQPAALRGEVRVSKPLDIKAVGDCLWHRRIVKVNTGGKHSHSVTQSDVSKMADFSIVIDGRDFIVKDLPTQVYGGHYRWTWTLMSYWLPVVDCLTVLGRVRQVGSQGVIVKDPKVGLVFSIHPAEHTAFRELVKAGIGLAVVAGGLPALYFILSELR